MQNKTRHSYKNKKSDQIYEEQMNAELQKIQNQIMFEVNDEM